MEKNACYIDFYSKQLLFNDTFPYFSCFQACGFKLEKFYKSLHFQWNFLNSNKFTHTSNITQKTYLFTSEILIFHFDMKFTTIFLSFLMMFMKTLTFCKDLKFNDRKYKTRSPFHLNALNHS